MDLNDLKKIDKLRKVPFDKCECFLHEHHRWVLPIIHYAQEIGALPKPCTLVMFDFHHDAKDPMCIDEIREIRKSGVTSQDLIGLCKDHLSELNDDWVKAGMELGLISNAVIFGVDNAWSQDNLKSFKDHQGNVHRIELAGLPGRELEYQGKLSDLCKKDILSGLWDILGWRWDQEKGFSFAETVDKIVLDFDLDCFVMTWKEYTFPWPDEVFKKEFLHKSQYWSTKGWSGRAFLDELVSRAGLLTIAREPTFCGDDKKADIVIRKVNHFLFDDKLRLKWKCTNCGHIYEGLEAGECVACVHPTSHYELLPDD